MSNNSVTLKCKQCGNALNPDEQFCSSCGAKIEIEKHKCKQCGNELMPDDYFCTVCGTIVEELENASDIQSQVKSEEVVSEIVTEREQETVVGSKTSILSSKTLLLLVLLFILIGVIYSVMSVNKKEQSITAFDKDFLSICTLLPAPLVIEEAIKDGANVNARDDNDWTALMLAIRYNTPEVVSLLIKSGAEINATNITNWTPLKVAAQYNENPEILSLLINAGANVNVRIGQRTPIMCAAQGNRNPAITRRLLLAGADINARGQRGETALIYAASNNTNPDVISVLLRYGADTSIRDNDGKQAIDYANENEYFKKDTPAYQQLLAASGGNITGNIAEQSSTPVQQTKPAVTSPSSEAQSSNPMPQPEPVSATNIDFFQLCSSGTPQQIKESIQNVIDINATDNPGNMDSDNWTPLMYAAMSNENPEVLSLLIQSGANVNFVSKFGWTSLKVAVRSNKNPQIVTTLLDAGANVHAADSNNKKAIDFANENSALRGTAVYDRLKTLTDGSIAVQPSTPVQQTRPATAMLQAGIYSLENSDGMSGRIKLTHANNQYDVDMYLANREISVVDTLEFKGSASIEGYKITVKSSDNPNAQLEIIVKDGTALIVANDEAEDENNVRIGLSFSGTYQVKYYENESKALLDWLVSNGKVPQYVQDKGSFVYDSNYNQVRITGNNVRLRSQPNTEARIVAAVQAGETSSYHGEWTNPQGEKWVLTSYYNPDIHADTGDFAWVYGQYTELLRIGFQEESTDDGYIDIETPPDVEPLSNAEYNRMIKDCPEFVAAEKHLNDTWKVLRQVANAQNMKTYRESQQSWVSYERQVSVAYMFSTQYKNLIPPAAIRNNKVGKDLAFAVVTEDRARWLDEIVKQERDPRYLPTLSGRLNWGHNPVGGYFAFTPNGWWTELIICYAGTEIPAAEQARQILENSSDNYVFVTVKGRLNDSTGFEWYPETPNVNMFSVSKQ